MKLCTALLLILASCSFLTFLLALLAKIRSRRNITLAVTSSGFAANLCDVVTDLIRLTGRIYPNIHQADVDCGSWLRERAIPTPTKDSTNSISNLLLEKLSTDHMKYKSVDTVMAIEDAVHYPVEFLHTLNTPGVPPHVLYLKVGAPIMLLHNLTPPKLCSGTRLQVKTLYKHAIEATILTGVNQGETVFIPRIPPIPSENHVKLNHLHFPVKVCYAITINKAQGQTVKVAGVHLTSDLLLPWSVVCGVCSRVTSPDSLVILQPREQNQECCLQGGPEQFI